MHTKVESIIDRTILVLLHILLFFTPLLFTFNTKESFEFPKMFFVYFLGSAVIFLFLFKSIWAREQTKSSVKRFFKSKLGVLTSLFVLANLISTIFGTHLYTSLFGYYSRFNGGIISVLVFFGILVVISNNINFENYKKLLITAVLAIFPVSIYAIFQHFQLSPTLWNTDEAVRVFSTLGQPNWLAAYLAMLLPICLFFMMTKNERKVWVFWAFSFILGFYALWFTYSLSGLLGFVVSIIAFAFLNLSVFKNKKVLFRIAFLGAFCIPIIFLKPGIWQIRIEDALTDVKRTYLVRHVSAQEQNSRTYNLSDSGNIRRGLWTGTLDLIVSSPKVFFVGTGPETFPYEFQKFRPKELNYTSEWNFIFNKPHNYYLEIWSNLGLFGLVSYLGLVIFSIYKKDKIATPALLALYVTNIFSWPTVATTLLFWFFLGKLNYEDK